MRADAAISATQDPRGMLYEVTNNRDALASRDLHGDVDALERAIDALVIERQALRDGGAARPLLEQNRRALVALQWQLSRKQIDAHVPTPDHRTAA